MVQGLSSQEAQKRLAQYGPNVLVGAGRVRPLAIFLSQFKNLLILILLAAAALSFFVGEALDAAVIAAIVLLNAGFGFVQEFRAENAIAALRKLVVSRVRVIRSGKEIEVDAATLVPGDVFLVTEGQKIPADATLVEAINLTVNEASLTGESLPAAKSSEAQASADEKSVFMGTVVERGRGLGKVTETGMNTRFGRIASLLSEIEDEETPFQKDLGRLGRVIILIGLFAAAAVVVLGTLRGQDLLFILLLSISLAVAIVPEGLPAIVTIALGLGTQRMARKNAIIRRLSAIETMGSADIIATDKTGTLTKNEMVVKKAFIDGKIYEEKDLDPKKNKKFAQILRIGAICSNASLFEENGQVKILGDSTEGSLLKLAQEHGLDYRKERAYGGLFKEFSFDRVLKRMSVIWDTPGAGYEVLTKSAPEILLDLSTLPSGEKEKIRSEIEALASSGLRLIGFGMRKVGDADPSHQITREEAEHDLEYLGFVAIYDPPRPEAYEAIIGAQKAGIEVKMITGDNPLTAQAIGREVGLVAASGEIAVGKDLDRVSDDKLKDIAAKVKIFARVSPEHKIRIVKALQQRGKIVAVTGDGVNDAPALKAADVGLAMGITGTDVAKEAADAVLADDNFASIVGAIREGRTIYDNIFKSIRYLLGCNSGELTAILGAVILGLPSPLTPIQILWMNLVTDGLPALALSEDKGDPKIMERPPRRKGVPVLNLLGPRWMMGVGLSLGLTALATFILLDFVSLEKARTATFTVFVVGEMIAALAVRGREKLFSNPLLFVAIGIALLSQAVIVFWPPAQKIFDTVPLF